MVEQKLTGSKNIAVRLSLRIKPVTLTFQSFIIKPIAEMLAQLSESDNPFRILDLYEHHDFQTDPDFYNDPRGPFLNNRYNIFTRDPEYCDSVDLYNMVNTSNWLDHRYYYSTHPFGKDLIAHLA